MKQLTANVLVETELRGSNHGLVTTSDGLVMIDGPHKPSDALRLRAEVERRGRLRYILNTEPHGDHWTANAFFDVPVIAHEGVRSRILGTDMAAHVVRVASFGPEEAALLEGYRPNAPVITFESEMTLHVGNHTFRMVHMPGYTPYQAAVIVEEEGVVFTSDNIFCKVHTWLQEADPDLWLGALESLRGLREETFVPGHGPVCDKRYLDEQGAFIHEWVDCVRRGLERGMTRDECAASLTAMNDDAYRVGHIPSAVWWYWKAALWHDTDREFPSPEAMGRRLGRIGVMPETTVVLYGDPVQYGTYAFWVFSMCGHPDVRILDGAKTRWCAEGRTLGKPRAASGATMCAPGGAGRAGSCSTHAPHPLARASEHPQAAACPRGRVQPRPAHAEGVRAGHAARAARPAVRPRRNRPRHARRLRLDGWEAPLAPPATDTALTAHLFACRVRLLNSGSSTTGR